MKQLLYTLLILLPLCAPAQTDIVAFEMMEDTITHTQADYDSPKAYKEFELKGKIPLKCAIKLLDEDNALLLQYYQGQWQLVDTLQYVSGLDAAFEISDFDNDGNEDFMLRGMINMHSNVSYAIYLNDPAENKLVILQETNDDGWVNPEYDPKKKIITCQVLGGMYGDYSVSTYRLENQTATPLFKKETDFTDFDEFTGKGGVYREYTGSNGAWKLAKEKKAKPK